MAEPTRYIAARSSLWPSATDHRPVFTTAIIHNKSDMASISATVAGPSQGEGSSPPHRSVEELMNWFSSELNSFLSINNGHPEGITTLATAIIPFSGCVVPTTVILSIVPLHLGTDQGSELSPFFPSQPSHLSVGYPMTRNDLGNDITIDPLCLEYTPTSDGFQIASRNSIPRPEVRYDHQLPGHGDPIQGPIRDGLPAVTALPGVAVYPSPFNQTFGAYPVSGQRGTLSSTPVNRGDIPPACTACQTEGNGRSASQQLGQSYQDTPTSSNSAGPVQGAGGDQLEYPSRHRCRECDASYARLSGLNRHYKDKHTAWMACRH
ncbi:hypothetical protein EDB92DRAFT_98946 [Lactarius akahatsu]|uniref:C2H2-type domain-containing protein n=1 Tax=Lactarius akahatsu TaxID=416441 RepID=A0AAD4LSN5_9AGAM|nr:hypothetical protein EDB92DRAFT_98946 [Lactarius akahatsu]